MTLRKFKDPWTYEGDNSYQNVYRMAVYKPWHKLRVYENGYCGQLRVDLSETWTELRRRHRKADSKYLFRFWDWILEQHPNARYITDMQLSGEGLEFETPEEKEAFVIWALMIKSE